MASITSVLPRGMTAATEARAGTLAHRPHNCVWELTLACNLRCAHCGSRAGRPRDRELDTAECLDVLDQLAALGCDLVTLSGGEPLLRRDWDVVARAAAERGMFVNLVTNGTLVSRDVARRALDAGLCNVGVSIDGPEAVHDGVRGAGAFRRAMAGIAHLRAAGMSVSVLTHVNRLNLDILDEVRAVAVEAGAATWRLQLGKPMGSLKDRGDLVIRPRDVLRLVPEVARLSRLGGIRVSVGDSIGYYGPHDLAMRGRGWRGGRPESWQGCQAGMQAIGIESDGGVKGCLSLQAREDDGPDPFREGSVRDRSLAELWFRAGAFAYNREFDPASLTGGCRRCTKAAVCRGGARCVAAAATGRLGEDPYCFTRVSAMDASPGLRTAIARGAAAASAAFAMTLGGCDLPRAEDHVADVAQAPDVPAGGKDVFVTPDSIGPDAINPPDPGAPDVVKPDSGAPDVVKPDPGAPDVAMPDPGADAIDCAKVCCECEYGIIPEEVWKECCAEPPADPAPDAAVPDAVEPDPGTPDAAAPDPGTDAIDCEQVCCMCDYGIIPEEVWQACCVPPAEPVPDTAAPDAVQPADAPADAIACEKVCCTCEYGILPEEVRKECCDICSDPRYSCCDCDYGESPPPQCCP